MPRADEYASAAALMRARIEVTQFPENEASYRLAARCVRAMAAVARGDVTYVRDRHGPHAPEREWAARDTRDGANPWHYAADPLDAITAALGGDDAP